MQDGKKQEPFVLRFYGVLRQLPRLTLRCCRRGEEGGGSGGSVCSLPRRRS